MTLVRLLFLSTSLLVLTLFTSGCGVIWGSLTVSGHNGNGNGTFAYTCSTQVFLEGVANAGNAPANGGSTFSISPPLPTGLSLNSSTGIISGTPTVVSPMTAYTVTSTGSQGVTSTTVNIRTAIGWLVNDLPDDAHNAGGAGNCTAAGFGTCTLRAAIDEINLGTSTRTVISLPSGSTQNALQTSGLGQINITQPMDIYGDCSQGTTVDAKSLSRVFNVTNSGDISFNSMTIQGGKLTNNDGAGILIINNAIPNFTATINNSTIQNNVVKGGAAFPWAAGVSAGGAAIGQQVILNINNSIFYNNQMQNTTGGAGALAVGGNGYFAQGTITNSSFISNSCNSIFSGVLEYAGLSLTVSSSLFYNNTSAGQAGVFSYTNGGVPPVNFINDTFDSNSATALGAGGILITSGAGGETVNFTNCTFANNSAPSGAGVLMNEEGGNLANDIFYNNSPPNCSAATMTSIGGNLSDLGSADCDLNQGSDIVNTNAQLSSLQNNGGPTQTMALLPTSPAIDHAVVVNCPATDQRGYNRPLPISCDIGAFENEP